MKKLIKIGLIALAFMCFDARPARAAISVGDLPLPGIGMPFQSRLELKMCQVRRLFCGNLATVIVTLSVFTIGIMLINNALHWGTAMIMIAGMIIFYYADNIAFGFGSANSFLYISNPLCHCDCDIDLGSLPTMSKADWNAKVQECAPQVGSGVFAIED